MKWLAPLVLLACADKTTTDTGDTIVDTGSTEDTGLEDTGSEDTGSEDTGSDDTSSDDTGSDDTGDEDTGDEPVSNVIVDIQTGVIATGETVELTDVIVSSPLSHFGFYVSTPDGGAHSGIWVYLNFDTETLEDIVWGDVVSITGTVAEYPNSCSDGVDNDGDGLSDGDDEDCANDGSEGVLDSTETLTEIDVVSMDDIVKSGNTATPPTAIVMTAAELLDPINAEMYEGVLVSLENVAVTETPDQYDEWKVDGVAIDDLFGIDAPAIGLGDTFSSVTGIVHYSYGSFKVEPRIEDDLQGWTRTCNGVRCIEDLLEGEIVVTELMINPFNDTDGDGSADCSDNAGEYIELAYVADPTADTVDIRGLELSDASNTVTITDSVVLSPGEVAWISTGSASCYGSPNAYLGSSQVSLNNTGSETITASYTDLAGSAVTLDTVTYDDTLHTVGVAIQLSGDKMTAVDNDDAANWCPATTAIANNVDLGNPGFLNEICPVNQ